MEMNPVWVSREDGMIKYADLGSRDFHADDVSIDAETFRNAEEFFGTFTVDGFASAGNAKCAKFFSKFDVPGSSGMDFFHASAQWTRQPLAFPSHWQVVSNNCTPG